MPTLRSSGDASSNVRVGKAASGNTYCPAMSLTFLAPRFVRSPLFVLALLASGCGGATHLFYGDGLAVGADATVEIEHQQAGTHDVRLLVRHLPSPSRITPGATAFAMWIVAEGHEPTLAGFLDYDEATRIGRLRATTPAPVFELRVTAERDREVESPSEHVALRHRIDT